MKEVGKCLCLTGRVDGENILWLYSVFVAVLSDLSSWGGEGDPLISILRVVVISFLPEQCMSVPSGII